jgi:phosphatidylinositol alpha-1,6-mannosyltransferase
MKDLIKKYSKIKYLIAGTGDTNYELELKKYVKKLNLTKNILFLGHVNEEEKIVIYNLCKIFLMTSLPTDKEGNSEGFGITFLEANACGKPVIGTRVGGIPDAIENGKNGYMIKPNSSNELKKIIIKLLDNELLYSTICANSINHVKNNFDVNLIGKKFESLIDKLYDSL